MLASFYKRSKNGYEWMETHIWHAKRFHVQAIWGHKVPVRCNDKCKRGVYRFTQLSSCLIDLSYYQTVSLSSKNGGSVWDIVSKFINYAPISSDDYLNGQIINPDTTQLICPCIIYKISPTQIILNLHPSAFEGNFCYILSIWEFTNN